MNINVTGSGIKRIIFTADILRPIYLNNRWESASRKNVHWLAHLISWQISRVSSLPQVSVAWEPDGFDAPSIYQSLGLVINANAWASIFYQKTLPAQTEERIVEYFQDACVIGYEIPDVLQSILTRHHIPFVDIMIHPVRFLNDLLFAFRTNDPRVHSQLLGYRFNLINNGIPEANLLRAKAMWMAALDLPANTALITGQTATDKALICRKEGKFLNLNNFKDKLVKICEQHPLVLFKPHPYQDAHCPSLSAIESLKTIRTVTHNFYYLLSQAGLSDVYAINASTITEATYFGRQGHYLGEELYTFGDKEPLNNLPGDYVPIGHSMLEPAYWADILEPLLPVHRDLASGPIAQPSLLRRSLNVDWDCSAIDELIQQDSISLPFREVIS